MSVKLLDKCGCVQKILLVITRASCETCQTSNFIENLSTLKVGSYSCDCHSGFVDSFGDCEDIDECSILFNICDRDSSTCNNSAEYERRDHQDLSETKLCQDGDLCQDRLHDCSNNAVCLNTGEDRIYIILLSFSSGPMELYMLRRLLWKWYSLYRY